MDSISIFKQGVKEQEHRVHNTRWVLQNSVKTEARIIPDSNTTKPVLHLNFLALNESRPDEMR